ncbi:hypothetical protein U0035_02255 [Niabella yanshanensis]|uniref:Uncharacterized protein n=1 Tax=Niabella yanshanensis TaxID=577386 RepID=A0ABZ0W8Y9_9BACT|nr:hypothetical protein [Niabella yanshanensis]WQD38967.1 hypothetical protein U0035_02255 [Niabella yanshanensis]
MKTYHLKQHSIPRSITIAIIYLIVIFALSSFFFGGINGMADKVNSMGSAKGAGFVVGIAVIAPLFILLRFLNPTVTVDIDDRKMTIRQKGKQDLLIHFNAIDRLELNVKNVNRLDIYDKQNNLLVYLQPNNQPQILQPIIRNIVNATGFHVIRGSRKIMGNKIDTLLYSNRAASTAPVH